MSLLLGKRKRRRGIDESDNAMSIVSDNEASDKSLVLFRQHFEAQFKPLDGHRPPQSKHELKESQVSTIDSDSDWEGLSDEEKVETHIIQSNKANHQKLEVSNDEFKSFMSSKPPSSSIITTSSSKPKLPTRANEEETITDAENLKKDIALQRLLKESYLLDPQNSMLLTGHNRHKALDLRLREMGSKSSNYKQQNMPLAQRKGINLKAERKEDTRRKEAKENGIILEKATKGKREKNMRRQRAIGTPSVGKFRGGILKLSKKDVAEIQGARDTRRVGR